MLRKDQQRLSHRVIRRKCHKYQYLSRTGICYTQSYLCFAQTIFEITAHQLSLLFLPEQQIVNYICLTSVLIRCMHLLWLVWSIVRLRKNDWLRLRCTISLLTFIAEFYSMRLIKTLFVSTLSDSPVVQLKVTTFKFASPICETSSDQFIIPRGNTTWCCI